MNDIEEINYRISMIEKSLDIYRNKLNFKKLHWFNNERKKDFYLSIAGNKVLLDDINPYDCDTYFGAINGRYSSCGLEHKVRYDLNNGRIIGDKDNENYKYYLGDSLIKEIMEMIYES